MNKKDYSICICTYKRPQVLRLLLEDIFTQNSHPNCLIIVDGDPSSGKVLKILEDIKNSSLYYIPSNHSNLSYQRYLGWKASNSLGSEFLIYFDDDLRLRDPEITESLIELLNKEDVVGVTATTKTGVYTKFINHPALFDRATRRNSLLSKITEFLDRQPGSLLPTGNRVKPVFDNQGVGEVEWLQGRVMAYRLSAIDETCFSDDLFALTLINCGLGEDTFLSRQVSRNGKMLITKNLNFYHPDDEMPNSYPIKAYNLAYATAYSRRFLNDHFRIDEPPHLVDRLALVKTYVGNNFINLFNACLHPKRHRFAYLRGYLKGSVWGLFQKPQAKTLSPDINWLKDAEEAFIEMVKIL